MSERDVATRDLIDALSGADASAALAAWGTLRQQWTKLPVPAQQTIISAALRTRQPWIASAARRFLTEHWEGWPSPVKTDAMQALGSLLDNPRRVSTTWPFLPDHWGRLPPALAALLSPERLSLALANEDVAADAWDFLATQWDKLPAPLKTVVTETQLGDALGDPDWRVATGAWEFLTENWPRLTKQLRSAPSTARVLAIGRNPVIALALEEFVATHGSALSQPIREAAHEVIARSGVADIEGAATCAAD